MSERHPIRHVKSVERLTTLFVHHLIHKSDLRDVILFWLMHPRKPIRVVLTALVEKILTETLDLVISDHGVSFFKDSSFLIPYRLMSRPVLECVASIVQRSLSPRKRQRSGRDKGLFQEPTVEQRSCLCGFRYAMLINDFSTKKCLLIQIVDALHRLPVHSDIVREELHDILEGMCLRDNDRKRTKVLRELLTFSQSRSRPDSEATIRRRETIPPSITSPQLSIEPRRSCMDQGGSRKK